MKLKIFNQTTLPKQIGSGGAKVARVAFGKGGVINFNGPACKLMDLVPGSKIILSQDETEPDNWYFFKDEKNGFDLRNGYDKKGCLFNHALLVKEVINHFKLPDNRTHNFLIAGQCTKVKGSNIEFWGIIVPAQ